MCGNPAAILGMQATGVGLNAIGAYGSAKSERSALNFQAQMQDLNAGLAERRAQIALDQGAFAAGEIERQGADRNSTIRAANAARGVALDEGTPLATAVGSDVATADDARQARINAVRAAWGNRTDATNLKNDAAAKRVSAKGINPWARAGTTLLTGATQMAQSAYSMKAQGAFS